MRWFDGLAIMVTFRQVDPLYAIDLTDPDAARAHGGSSRSPASRRTCTRSASTGCSVWARAHAATGSAWGAQAGLFNVTDLTDPRQLDVVSYGRNSHGARDPGPAPAHLAARHRTVLTVVSDYRKGGQVGLVSVLRLGDGELANRTVEVEYGNDVSAVRLVPLPDGRVVLVTGGDASSSL